MDVKWNVGEGPGNREQWASGGTAVLRHAECFRRVLALCDNRGARSWEALLVEGALTCKWGSTQVARWAPPLTRPAWNLTVLVCRVALSPTTVPPAPHGGTGSVARSASALHESMI